MRGRWILAAVIVAAAAMAVAAFAFAGGTGAAFNHLAATLSGYQETPSISSTGTAEFTADISKDGQSLAWQLTYANLEGTVTQSHIHFGQRAVAGGISVFLCTNLGNGPAGTQACPQPTSGPVTISGTITPADVSPNIPATAGARAQGLNTAEWDEFIRAVDAGKTYANLHTSTWPAGEIRAQLNEGDPHN